MTTVGPDDAAFLEFRNALNDLAERVRKSSAVHQNTKSTLDLGRSLVQTWFRAVRPGLQRLRISEESLAVVDGRMQDLLRLTQGRSRTTSYRSLMRELQRQLSDLDLAREVALGVHFSAQDVEASADTEVEARIIATLSDLVPSAALSYRQALIDLRDPSRVSYRGTANELRSVLWDVLDRLAPDEAVSSAPGFKLEKDRKKPTQKQKARYILKSRLGDSARKAPEGSIALIEEHVGSLSRAVYDRTSISTHLEAARGEVAQVKMYLDTVVAELLEIHHG